MPTRITRSFSRRGLFGGRVRYTTSQTIGSRTSTQVHLTGRDLLEMQRIHDETVARLRAEHEQQKTEHLSRLNTIALWLHKPVVTIPALVFYGIILLVALATSGNTTSDALGSVMGFLLLVLTAVPAVADWWNFRTLHGNINWPLLKLDHPRGYWWAIVGLVLFFFVPGVAYFIQALRTSGAVAQAQREHMQGEIARLEHELHPELNAGEQDNSSR